MSPLVRDPWWHRMYAGATQIVIPSFGAGALVGVATGVPVILCAGAGAMVGIVIGSLLGLLRPM